MKNKAFGTYQIAKICQVAPITVGRWIAGGKLPYFTTGGGHRRVWDEDLVKFLRAHNYPIPQSLKASLKKLVLIVEDEAPTRRLIRRIINKKFSNYQIEEAADGYEAGEKILSLIPSLVVLDIRLPGLDGFKICKRIRKNKTLKTVKIMAITGDLTAGVKEKILKAGANAFLTKPFDNETFLKIFTRLLGPVI